METLKDFIARNTTYKKDRDVDPSLIEKYRDVLPAEILYIWENYGFGTFENGFIRFVDPEAYNSLLGYCDIYLEPTIVFGVTALGDLLVWEGNKNATVAQNEGNRYAVFLFRKGKKEILGTRPFVINRKIGDREFIEDKDYFDASVYFKIAEAERERLAIDESFGFSPLPALGGKEKVENIKIVKTKEYLDMIGQMVGQVG